MLTRSEAEEKKAVGVVVDAPTVEGQSPFFTCRRGEVGLSHSGQSGHWEEEGGRSSALTQPSP